MDYGQIPSNGMIVRALQGFFRRFSTDIHISTEKKKKDVSHGS